jgi:REP element-mobilizing transposase RayT
MATPSRNEEPGAVYHVIARGVDRRHIFVDDDDYGAYTGLLASVTRRQGWRLLSYCLMPNHVHVMVETPEPNLGSGMQWLQSNYAKIFNKRHVRSGHLFEDRFKSPKVSTDEAFITLVGYIAVNPVAAALCKRASDWPWGSHSAVVSRRKTPGWLSHARLLERLDAVAPSDAYHKLVATRERAHY